MKDYMLIFYIGMLVFYSVLLGYIFGYLVPISNLTETRNLINNIGMSNNCENLSIEEMSRCLKIELKESFKYNLSNTGKELSLEQLKEEGGVCSHFSEWYKNKLIELGGIFVEEKDVYFKRDNASFYITKKTIPVSSKISHVYIIISNEEGYCKLDQLNVDCWRFEKNDAL